MKMTIEPTEEFFMAGDVMVRLWQGTTENGGEVLAFVAAVCGRNDTIESLARDLISIPPPTPEEARLWAEKVLTMQALP